MPSNSLYSISFFRQMERTSYYGETDILFFERRFLFLGAFPWYLFILRHWKQIAICGSAKWPLPICDVQIKDTDEKNHMTEFSIPHSRTQSMPSPRMYNTRTETADRNTSHAEVSNLIKPVVRKGKYSKLGCTECKRRKIKVCIEETMQLYSFYSCHLKRFFFLWLLCSFRNTVLTMCNIVWRNKTRMLALWTIAENMHIYATEIEKESHSHQWNQQWKQRTIR